MLSSLSLQWFTAYYVALGTLLLGYGIYLIAKQNEMADYLVSLASDANEAPRIFRSVLKYLLLFTLPGLFLSFFPFSWIELIFSTWCLVMIYTVGQLLIQWPILAKQILSVQNRLPKKVRFAGINMISLGVVMFMLCYVLISNH